MVQEKIPKKDTVEQPEAVEQVSSIEAETETAEADLREEVQPEPTPTEEVVVPEEYVEDTEPVQEEQEISPPDEIEPVPETSEETSVAEQEVLPEEMEQEEKLPDAAPESDVGEVAEIPSAEEIVETESAVEPEETETPEDLLEQVAEVETEPEAAPEPEPVPEPESEPEPETAVEAEEVPELVTAPEPVTVPEPAPEPVEDATAVESADVPKSKYQQPAQKPSIARKDTAPAAKSSAEKKGLFSRLSQRLSKTRESFTYQMDALFLGKKEIDTSLLDNLEEILILADLGVGTTQDLLEHARKKVRRKELKDPAALRELLKEKITEYIIDNEQDATLVMPAEGPFVIMVIGVNGVGKTTTIGKIANKFINAGNSVMLVAADTFRAAAIAQLEIWGERNNVPVIAHKEGSDPSSVVFDGIGAALEQNVDVVLVDTAGRLHTKANLMEELKKIKRVMDKKLPGAPHETLLVIDATTGQNGVSQAKLFNEAVTVTGLALTKLDGTSKGGIVANICKDLKIPIRFIGIGEQVEDLRDFEPGEFVDALFQSRTDSE